MKKLDKKFRFLIYASLVVITLVFPFLGLLLSAVFYFFADTNKSVLVFSALLGILVGFFAYNFVPASNFDLVRHQYIAERYESVNDLESFAKVYETTDREPLVQVFSFLVSRTGNVDLLQFFAVAIGYGAIFYILADYRNRVKIKKLQFFIIFVLMLFGQHTLYYFSGLYNYVAICLFALAFYLDYFHGKKFLPYIIYIASIFIHTSMILPAMLLLIFKLSKSKPSKKIYALSVIAMLIGVVGLAYFDIGGSGNIQTMFANYFSNNAYYFQMYGGLILAIDVIKIVLMLYACRIAKADAELEKIRAFVLLILPIIILLLPVSIVLIRLVSLVFYISIPLVINVFACDGAKIKITTLVFLSAAIVFAAFNIKTIYPYGYKNFIIEKLPTTTSEFFVKGKLND